MHAMPTSILDRDVRGQPRRAILLHDPGALLYAAAVEDHHRDHEATVLRAPPTRGPVRIAQIFERTGGRGMPAVPAGFKGRSCPG